jgi:hypothetical protein
VLSCLGGIRVRRHWWGNRCGCAAGAGYQADGEVGLTGSLSRRLQQHVCRLAADVSFAATAEHLRELLGVRVSAEVVRTTGEGHGRVIAAWQPKDERTAARFRAAAGSVEFTVDAGKVNTREEGWKDLKIAVLQKRPAGPAVSPGAWEQQRLPAPTATVAWAAIAAAKQFRKSWRGWSRRVGVAQPADLQVVADGAAWIWASVDRVLTGSQQTLDIFHACEHLAGAGTALYGEGTPAAAAFLARGRERLLRHGWDGVCQVAHEEYAAADTPPRRAALERLVAYFVKHKGRLNYADRLATGRVIGSGAVEGQAKTLGLRLKARGARWRKGNVRPMASLVCARHSDQWPTYWKSVA